MFRLLSLTLLFALALTAVPAAQDDPALIAKSQEFSRLLREKNYAAALTAGDEAIALARKAAHPALGALVYNKACVLALLGRREEAVAAARDAVAAGYTRYQMFASDSDLDSLRDDPAFRALLAQLREKYGPKPLAWDETRTVSSFPITYDEPAAPELAMLRREFQVDAVLQGLHGDYERLKALTAWTSRQWQHSPTQMASKPDPLTILREARGGGRFICRDYAIVAAGVARAYGLHSRVLNLLPADVETRSEAHSVAEVWVPGFDKWVLADGQYGTIAESGGVPLGGVELQAALARDDAGVSCAAGADRCREWKLFILPNMFYFKIAANQRRFAAGAGPQLVLVPRGAADPRKFAGGNEEVFAGSVYISDPRPFYAGPR
jgi:hypothetical protein